MRALVTGADGFVGQWLLTTLLAGNYEVSGIVRGSEPALSTLPAALAGQIAWHTADMTDATRLRNVVRESVPGVVFHLAAQSFVPTSTQDPLGTIDTNVLGTAHLLQAVRDFAPDAKVLVVGSADAYGAVTLAQLPVREEQPLSPRNPYAASKAAAELVALQYARAGWCRAVATRSFNHTGPGQRPAFAVASFARQVAAIKAKQQAPIIEVGDLTPRRDLCDVRDVVNAYVGLAKSGESGRAYNVCTGTDVSMADIVKQLLSIGGVTADIRQKPELVRPTEIPVLRGDPSLIMRQIGWKPKVPLSQTLADMLEFFAHAAA
jgi:GDP-4-dehydro-6-deoxy-D-mannose reductase